MTLVSIIIPTYGRADLLGKAIESVLNQSYKEIEVIVVDDNVPHSAHREKTKSIVASYLQLDTRVLYLPLEKNMGGALARNEGVKKSSGEYITFLDDDDYYFPSKIEKQVSVLEQGLDICTCSMIALDEGRSADYIRTKPNGDNLSHFLLDGSAFTPMIMVRRNTFLTADGFIDTPRFQDHTLMLRLLSKTDKVFLLDEPLFVHNLHLGDRVSFSPKTRLAFKIKHELENSLSDCLIESQLNELKRKQRLENLECDLFEFGFLDKIKRIYQEVVNAKNLNERIFLLKFSIRKSLRKNNLVWWIRRKFLSKEISLQ